MQKSPRRGRCCPARLLLRVDPSHFRNNLIAVRNGLPSIRTSLISTLATIYPIELLSTSELLFTILDVPLPIPFNSHEPAPPLSLSSHKEVTEESVATALGYAGQLVQLLSVYMGKGLVYPMTYIGSRSLIRDNISAMVGPRMYARSFFRKLLRRLTGFRFPLFSRGVDTYRFEYAVFLLNKDIEMVSVFRSNLVTVLTGASAYGRPRPPSA